MTPVPLVHIITKLEFGGAQQVALDILAHVDRARFTPHLITGQEGYLMEAARDWAFRSISPGTWSGRSAP